MERVHHKWTVRPSEKAGDIVKGRGAWGVYGEAMGNPKFAIGGIPKNSEFLRAARQFIATHEELLDELAKS
jgi:hypothetical protein